MSALDLISVALLVLPGAIAAFGSPSRSLGGFWVRFSLMVCFGPAISALVVMALQWAGVSFAISAHALIPLAVIGTIFLVRWVRGAGSEVWGSPLVAVLLAAVSLFPLAVTSPIEGHRLLGWHGLMHLDLCIAAAEPGLVLQDRLVAGLPLVYYWPPHYGLSAAAFVTDTAPLVLMYAMYPVLLFSMMMLVYEAVRALGGSVSGGLVAVIFVSLGAAPVALIDEALSGKIWLTEAYGIDPRAVQVLGKFVGPNTNAFGLLAVTACAWSALQVIAGKSRLAPVVLSISMTVGSLLYLPLLPIYLVAGWGAWLVRLLRSVVERRRPELDALLLSALLVASALGGAFYLWVSSSRIGGGAVEFGLTPGGAKGLLLAIMPAVLIAGLGCRRAFGRQPFFIAWCGFLAAVSFGLYLFISVKTIEYKFISAGWLGLSLLCGLALPGSEGRRKVTIRVALAFVLLLCCALNALRSQILFNNLATWWIDTEVEIPALDMSRYELHLAPGDPHFGWIEAIRNESPLDAIVVCGPSTLAISTITNRSEYAARDLGYRQRRVGYYISIRDLVVDQAGHGAVEYDRRIAVADILIGSGGGPVEPALKSVLELGRPVVLVFDGTVHPTMRWLEEQGRGRRIWSEPARSVWLLE